MVRNNRSRTDETDERTSGSEGSDTELDGDGSMGDVEESTIQFTVEPDPGTGEPGDRDGATGHRSDGGEQPSRGNTTGRSAGTEPEPQTEDISSPRKVKRTSIDGTAEAIGGLLMLGSVVVARRLGEEWLISEQEAKEFGKASVKCLKHAPIPAERLGLSMDLLGLAGVVGAIVGPRYLQWRQRMMTGMTPQQFNEVMRRAQAERNGVTPEQAPQQNIPDFGPSYKTGLND